MTPQERENEEQLLHRAVLAGDRWAWQRLYDDSFEAIDRYALWRCGGSREQADEVVQETWLVAVRRIGQFQPERGSFIHWARGIAANVLRNHLRRLKKQRTETLHGDPQSNGQAADSMRRSQQAQRVALALAALPERYEQVLRAKYVDGFRVAEIAQQRSETAKGVESLLTRAREAFRHEYNS